VVRRAYEWTYLYAAVDPTSGESFCLYLPGMDGFCLEAFLEDLGEAYADHHLLLVLDGAPSHTSGQVELPENVSLMRLPSYSPELNPVERWFQEFRRALSNRVFSRPSSCCKRHSRRRWSHTGGILPGYEASPVSPGGWKPSNRWDINALDQYYSPKCVEEEFSEVRIQNPE
jgi:transposase